MQSFRMIKPVCCREQWGIFECQLAGNKKRVTIKGTWPVLAEDLVPGSQYRAVLKTETFKGKPQYVATDPKLEKVDQPKAFALAQLLIQVDSALRPAVKKMMERSEADPNLVDRLIGADLATIRKLLSVQESTAAKILDAIQQVSVKIELLARYVCIPAEFILSLKEEQCAQIEEQPYLLHEFLKHKHSAKKLLEGADAVSKAVGGAPTNVDRLQRYTEYALAELTDDTGSYWHMEGAVYPKACEAMSKSWDSNAVTQSLVREAARGYEELKWHEEQGLRLVATRKHHDIECHLAAAIAHLLQQPPPSMEPLNLAMAIFNGDRTWKGKPIGDALCEKVLRLDKVQRNGLVTALGNPLSILTGEAGRGKSSVTAAILKVCNRIGEESELLLAAPTGKAANRLEELSGKKASTIHSLIGKLKHGSRKSGDERKGYRVALDELSMVAPELLLELIEAFRESDACFLEQLILVGDVSQLPSVDPGATLRDLLNSAAIPSVRLQTVHRQGSGSTIATNATDIAKGSSAAEAVLTRSAPGWTVEKASNVDKAVQYARQHHAADEECMVMAQTNQTVNVLNRQIQAFRNPVDPAKAEAEGPPYSKNPSDRQMPTWRVGDEVVCKSNVYESQGGRSVRVLANGEVGTIEQIREVDERQKDVVVNFKGFVKAFPAKTFDIKHAYARTVHGCQGDESKHAIVVVDNYYKFQCRESLYTAVTRGQESVVILGDMDKLIAAANRSERDRRRTRLVEMLKLEVGEPGDNLGIGNKRKRE